jgi:hypothetical protein
MRAKLNCHQPLKYSNKEYKSRLIKRNRPIVKIIDTVDRAWNATVQEFEKAKVSGEASIWTEDTLRLIFFRHLCEQGLNIERVLAETAFHLGETDYKPDIVIDVLENNELKTVVFELKYFNEKWFSDWEKLRLYGIIGWDYGYFLGIGSELLCKSIPKFEKQTYYQETHSCELRGLTHPTARLEYAPHIKIVEDLLKKSLPNVPYILAPYGAVALVDKFEVNFDLTAKDEKYLIWVRFPETMNEQKLKESGLNNWMRFNEEGKILSSEKFLGNVILGEFSQDATSETVREVKATITRFMEKAKTLSH